MSACKVSVIVATFRSGPELDRLVASLDAQSMPVDEFEVIFVDDGSGDGTADRLRNIAATRNNVRVMEIENSGWPSRPRNVGVDAASGEYVAFLDHDDTLYPDGLRAAYEAGAAIGADFVNPKEVSTRGWAWGWDVWREDRAVDRAALVAEDVSPRVPHKLYRRAFLTDHAIRFPEGRDAIWEDFYVNAQVFEHAQNVAILASTPYYKWHRDHGSNNGDRQYDDLEGYWTKLDRLNEFIEREVSDPAGRLWFITSNFRRLVLDLLGPRLLTDDQGFVENSLPHIARYIERWVPEEVENELESLPRIMTHLARSGDLGALIELAGLSQGIRLQGESASLAWSTKGLAVHFAATLCDRDGEALPFRTEGDRVIRVLGTRLDSIVPVSLRDVTDEVMVNGGGMSVRSRSDRLFWRASGQLRTEVVSTDDGSASVRVEFDAELDPQTGAFGHPWSDGVWDVGVRFESMGIVMHTPVAFAGAAVGAVLDTRTALAYSTARDALALDLANAHNSFIVASRLELAAAQLGNGRLEIPLRGVWSVARPDVAMEIALDGDRQIPARIEAGPEGRARLIAQLDLGRGQHSWRVVYNERSSKNLPKIAVGLLGRARLLPGA